MAWIRLRENCAGGVVCIFIFDSVPLTRPRLRLFAWFCHWTVPLQIYAVDSLGFFSRRARCFAEVMALFALFSSHGTVNDGTCPGAQLSLGLSFCSFSRGMC